jgi:hypothetical protein
VDVKPINITHKFLLEPFQVPNKRESNIKHHFQSNQCRVQIVTIRQTFRSAVAVAVAVVALILLQ